MSACPALKPALSLTFLPACLAPPPLHTHAGAVKITPAHDPNDFATGKRHGLDFINVLDDNGNINASDATGQFAGQPRFKVRGVVRACVDACEEGTRAAALFLGV